MAIDEWCMVYQSEVGSLSSAFVFGSNYNVHNWLLACVPLVNDCVHFM